MLEGKGIDPNPHVRRINHEGSVKSMESQAILESCRRLIEEDGCVVAQLGLDGDATTQALCQTELLENPAQRLLVEKAFLI